MIHNHCFKKRKTDLADGKRNGILTRVRQGIHIQKPEQTKVALTGHVQRHRPVTKVGVEGRGLDIRKNSQGREQGGIL